MGIDFDSIKNSVNGDDVDQVAEFASSRFGDRADDIDAVAGKAKEFAGNDSASGPRHRLDENTDGNDAPAGDHGGRPENNVGTESGGNTDGDARGNEHDDRYESRHGNETSRGEYDTFSDDRNPRTQF
jgi:hypothetical protein